MVLVEDDFIDEFLAELDVLKIKLTYLVLNEILQASCLIWVHFF